MTLLLFFYLLEPFQNVHLAFVDPVIDILGLFIYCKCRVMGSNPKFAVVFQPFLKPKKSFRYNFLYPRVHIFTNMQKSSNLFISPCNNSAMAGACVRIFILWLLKFRAVEKVCPISIRPNSKSLNTMGAVYYCLKNQ